MPKTTNSYGPDGTLHTTMDREGMDIGPAPDYWADLEKIRSRLKPVAPGARQQAQALAPSGGGLNGPSAPPPEYDPEVGMQRTSRSYGTPSMSPQGVLGTYVNPLDVPLKYQGQVKTGFYTDDAMSNYGYSPTVSPSRYGQPSK